MTAPVRLATYFHVHLISDSTGETLNAMIKAVCARFDNVTPIEHIYPLVRSLRQLERVLREIEEAPGVVIHTVVDRELRVELEAGCRSLETPCLAALDPLTAALGRYLGAQLVDPHRGAACAGCGVLRADRGLELRYRPRRWPGGQGSGGFRRGAGRGEPDV